jgi:hypothetical protein
MANYGSGSVGAILVGGYDLLAETTDVSPVTVESIMEETTCLGDTWFEQTPVGVRRGYFTQNGFYDDAAAKLNAITVDLQTTSRVVCLLHEGNTIGKRFVGMAGAYSQKYDRILERAKLHKANVQYSVSGQVEQGVILQEFEAKTADWNTEGADSFDGTASSADGGAGYQQVGAFTGFTGFVGKVRHSADDVTYADLITFTNVTAARQAERVTVSGTVNRYLAFDGNVTGSGSLDIFAGFVRN